MVDGGNGNGNDDGCDDCDGCDSDCGVNELDGVLGWLRLVRGREG